MDILRNMKSLVYVSQVCAIVPFYSERKWNSDYFISKLSIAYGYIVFSLVLGSSCVFVFIVLCNGSEYRTIKSSRGDTEEINQTIETVFCILSYMMIAVSSVLRSKKHFHTLQDIHSIDDKLLSMGFKDVFRCRLLCVLSSIVLLGAFATAFYYINFKSDLMLPNRVHLLIIYWLHLMYSIVFALYLRLLLMNLVLRLTFLNERLNEFITDSPQKNSAHLTGLIELFCKYREVADNINCLAGVSLLCYIGFAFYTITNKSYLAFSTLTTHETFANKYDAMGLSLVWVAVEVFILIIICNSCDAFTSEANTTAEILARVYAKNIDFQNIIDKFLTKSIKQEINFTAYGFFTIDNSTLFKIFSAVTTYLVILIQFKQLEESKLEDVVNT